MRGPSQARSPCSRAAGVTLSRNQAPSSPGVLEHEALTPPLLFREVWQQPPHTGPLNDENRRITPQAADQPRPGAAALRHGRAQHTGDRAQRHPRPMDRLHDLACGTRTATQERLPRSDGTDEDALEDAHGEPACPASDREARGRHSARRQPNVHEPAEADDGIKRLLWQFRGVRGDLRRSALVPSSIR